MEHYKLLGVDENASMEEVKRAYENKVNQFKEDIKDEKRVKAFIKEFDKAYEAIKKEREKGENRGPDVRKHSNNNFNKNVNDDSEEEYTSRKRRRNKSSTTSRANRGSNKGKRQSENSNKDNEKKVVRQKRKSSSKGGVVQLPLKILAIPIILILSIVIFLCNIINLISWVASKIIIVAAISASAIHGYQIYTGHAVKYEIFIISAVGFIAALFLPSILKVVPSALGGINNKLKRFVF